MIVQSPVLHVITGLGLGGAESMLRKLLLAKDGHRAAAVVSLTDLGALGPSIVEAGVPVHALGMRRGRLSLAALMRLAGVIRQLQPSVILGWMYHANIAALAARALARSRAPLVWNIRHTPYDLSAERRLTSAMIMLGARLSGRPARIIYNARVSFDRHVALGYHAANGIVIPNGFDLAEFAPSKARRHDTRAALGILADVPVIGHVARFHPMKDHAAFIQAAGIVLRRFPAARFLLAGPHVDADNSRLAELCRESGIGDRALLLGSSRRVRDLLPAFDVFCLSSAWGEGFPNVLGEAMACGVPPVTTDVGDAAAIVGDTGRVVSRQSPGELADACIGLLALPAEARAALGRAARARVESCFSLAEVCRAYDALFDSVGEPRGARGNHGA